MHIFLSTSHPNHTGAWSLLAQCVREVWGLDPLPPVVRAEGGKPYFPDHPQFHFNLSHSGPYTLCALSDSPVGADIQIIKDSWNPRLPARVCDPAQLAWLETQPDQNRAFALLWCLKEARVKQTGAGLREKIRAIAVPLPVPGRELYQLDGLWFRVYEGPDYWAAVCGDTVPPEILGSPLAGADSPCQGEMAAGQKG